MATRTNRRTRMTKKLLQEALIELLQEKQLAHITIKEVCQQADLNRTTFYLHYNNIEDLFSEIEEDAENHIKEYVVSIHSEKDKVRYIALLLDYIRQNPALFRVLLCGTIDTELQEKFFRHLLDTINIHPISGATAKQSQYAKAFVVNGCLGLVNAWFERGFDLLPETLAEQIFKMCDSAYTSIAR